MSNEFRVGDEVICIDDDHSSMLKINKEYIISKIDTGPNQQLLSLEKMGESRFFARRFRLLKLKEKEQPMQQPEFDKNADISRQYTRGGKKVLRIIDTEEKIIYPLTVLIEGHIGFGAYMDDGKMYDNPNMHKSKDDLITRPLPDVYKFFGSHKSGTLDQLPAKDETEAETYREYYVSIVKMTFNPNTNKAIVTTL
jgi:hypothetical protein